MQTILLYTIFLPVILYGRLKDRYGEKVESMRNNHIIKSQHKYKKKALKEILRYVENTGIPKEVIRSEKRCEAFEYAILLEPHQDTSANLHLKDFISTREYRRGIRVINKKSRRYYKACRYNRVKLDYSWFMDEIEKHFAESCFVVDRGVFKAWYDNSEFIELSLGDSKTGK